MQPIALKPDHIDLWYARDEQITEPALLAAYRELLEPGEQSQLQRFHFPRHRRQYLVARVLVRSVLSCYIDTVAPRAWRFRNNSYGKPAVVNAHDGPLHFNLSHSAGMVVLAVARGGELGVDVEWCNRGSDIVDLADHYFSPLEVRQLHRLPAASRCDRFFDFWTLKEAYIKACGMGLSIPLHDFGYVIAADGGVDIVFEPRRNDRPELWQFWQVAASVDHKLALAYRSGSPRTPCSLAIREVTPLRGYVDVACDFTHHLPAGGESGQSLLLVRAGSQQAGQMSAQSGCMGSLATSSVV